MKAFTTHNSAHNQCFTIYLAQKTKVDQYSSSQKIGIMYTNHNLTRYAQNFHIPAPWSSILPLLQTYFCRHTNKHLHPTSFTLEITPIYSTHLDLKHSWWNKMRLLVWRTVSCRVCPIQNERTHWLNQLFGYFTGIQTKWFYRQHRGRKMSLVDNGSPWKCCSGRNLGV